MANSCSVGFGSLLLVLWGRKSLGLLLDVGSRNDKLQFRWKFTVMTAMSRQSCALASAHCSWGTNPRSES